MIGILFWALALAQQQPQLQTKAETYGSCSPVVVGAKGDVTITCSGVDPAAVNRLERIPALLEQLIRKQVDAAEIRSRLDAITDALAPAPSDHFRIHIIKTDAEGKLTLHTFTFPVRDIPVQLPTFRHLLAQLPDPVAESADVLVLRWRDEEELSSAVTARTNGNTAVIVMPRTLIVQIGDRHLAFEYLKSQIEAAGQ